MQAVLDTSILIIGYHLASRLAYVVGVGVALKQEEEHKAFTRPHGIEGGFRKFRRIAAALMNNDAISFFLLCILTRDTIRADLPAAVPLVGVAFAIVGITVKVWAARSLAPGSFYWRNFFAPAAPMPYDPRGPYRFMKNPMYTLGYIHMYGWALMMTSLPGLIAAAFDQVAMLMFYHYVEKPHYEQLAARAP